jgi:hypothetical protein
MHGVCSYLGPFRINHEEELAVEYNHGSRGACSGGDSLSGLEAMHDVLKYSTSTNSWGLGLGGEAAIHARSRPRNSQRPSLPFALSLVNQGLPLPLPAKIILANSRPQLAAPGSLCCPR